MDQRTISTGGQQIAYTQSPGSGRPVIFVHGNSSSARTWDPVIAGRFGQRFRCLALDLPGHGQSGPAPGPVTYSLPGYAAVLAGFAAAAGAADAVIVGWSLGGHIALEAAPSLPATAGYVIFGAPPVGAVSQMPTAFLPNPAMNAAFTATLDAQQAAALAASFTAPGSALPLDGFIADILRTDGAARAGLGASISEGRFADQTAIAASLPRPLAILHGEHEQLVSLSYLRTLAIPRLWRGEIQLIPGAGHAPHQETPDTFATLLEQFITELN
jgi:pimeloyl-ACP methyl ester carboxylesterase